VATLLRRALTLLRAPANELAFGLRSRLRWSRGRAQLVDEPKDQLFAHLGAGDRGVAEALEERLRATYALEALRAASTCRVYAANLDLLDGLERLCGDLPIPSGPDAAVRAVDVGCGDFHYATALAHWLARRTVPARRVVLRGLEVDGFGIYADGHSRADHARAHAAAAAWTAGHVQFEVADVCRVRLPEQDFVAVLYPFVFAYPLLQWGLPLSRFRPAQVLRRAATLLRPGGLLVVANQTAAEAERTAELLANAPLQRLRGVGWASRLVPYAAATAERRATVWQRR
jgi:SAM-dependent methyltransferase